MHDLRIWMIRCLGAAGLLTLGLTMFGGLWAGLWALGDHTGAAVCEGIFWGFVVCWGLNATAIVGLLSQSVIRQDRFSGDASIQPDDLPPS